MGRVYALLGVLSCTATILAEDFVIDRKNAGFEVLLPDGWHMMDVSFDGDTILSVALLDDGDLVRNQIIVSVVPNDSVTKSNLIELMNGIATNPAVAMIDKGAGDIGTKHKRVPSAWAFFEYNGQFLLRNVFLHNANLYIVTHYSADREQSASVSVLNHFLSGMTLTTVDSTYQAPQRELTYEFEEGFSMSIPPRWQSYEIKPGEPYMFQAGRRILGTTRMSELVHMNVLSPKQAIATDHHLRQAILNRPSKRSVTQDHGAILPLKQEHLRGHYVISRVHAQGKQGRSRMFTRAAASIELGSDLLFIVVGANGDSLRTAEALLHWVLESISLDKRIQDQTPSYATLVQALERGHHILASLPVVQGDFSIKSRYSIEGAGQMTVAGTARSSIKTTKVRGEQQYRKRLNAEMTLADGSNISAVVDFKCNRQLYPTFAKLTRKVTSPDGAVSRSTTTMKVKNEVAVISSNGETHEVALGTDPIVLDIPILLNLIDPLTLQDAALRTLDPTTGAIRMCRFLVHQAEIRNELITRVEVMTDNKLDEAFDIDRQGHIVVHRSPELVMTRQPNSGESK